MYLLNSSLPQPWWNPSSIKIRCVLHSKWRHIVVCHPVSSRDVQDPHVAPFVHLHPLTIWVCSGSLIFFPTTTVILIGAVSEDTKFLFALSSEHEVKPAAILNRSGVLELLKYLRVTIHTVLRSLLSFLYCLEFNNWIKGHARPKILSF